MRNDAVAPGRQLPDADRALRVAVIATHPIQYQAPWFRGLAAVPDIDLKVYFAMMPDADQQGVGFGVPFQWDVPLLDGYHWELLPNTASRPRLGSFRGCNTPGIYRALRDWHPHVVILTGWHSLMMVQALWACIRLRLPRIVRGESNALRPRPRWKRLGHRLLFRSFDRVLAIGKANRALYEQEGVPQSCIFDCPYFVDNERFGQAAANWQDQRAEIREFWQIKGDACCVLFAGKLTAKKRPIDLIRAVGLARDKDAPLHLLVVGTGELMETAQRMAQEHDIPVSFAGFLNQSEIARAYVAADCLVLPSDAGETWGLVVNEAMVCGLPAIVSDQVGCGPDLVHDGETGGLFPMGDVGALADKLIQFASDPPALQQMGRRAQQLVLTRYSVERTIDGTLAAIRGTLSP